MQKTRIRKNRTDSLDVARVVEDFQRQEESSSHREGTFKIDKPFEEALNSLLKAKPKDKTATLAKKP
jgi:hypothetical protein